jgi:shikimate dehydrogenase
VTPLRFAVVGDPIAHSKSPAMHAAAYRALGLPHSYEAIRAGADELAGVVAALRAGTFHGVNVTVPHKERVLGLVDEVDPSAALVRAANTLVRSPTGRIQAHNTDVRALEAELLALEPRLSELSERTGDPCAVVLGAGGAARAAVAALKSLGLGPVVVRARNEARREPMLAELRASLHHADSWLRGQLLRADSRDERDVDVVIQTTSAGMHGADPGDAIAAAVAWDALPDAAVALDVVYAPPETPFLRAARARGLRCANGLGMLARQGALAFELWLGVAAPLPAMLAALAAPSR